MKKRILAQITNQMADAVLVCTKGGEVEFVNCAFERMSGYGADELLGASVELLPLLWQRQMQEVINASTHAESVVLLCKDGSRKMLDLTVSPFQLDRKRSKEFLILVGRDVTAQRALELELEDARKRLEQKSRQLESFNRSLQEEVQEEIQKGVEKHRLLVQQSKMAAMGEMMGAIAHQWRQPITAIASAAMALRMKQELGVLEDRHFEQGLESIERQTQRMSQTIHDFMNFFKPDKEAQSFGVRQMLNEIYGLLSAQFVYRGIEFINDVPRSMVLCGYRSELEQVVLNLLANARDAFERASNDRKWVRIYTSLYEGKLDLVIEDNAGGIDEMILDRVCEPYFTTKETGQGTGIGLYMSKTILQNSFRGDLIPKNRYNEEGNREGALFVVAIGREHLTCPPGACKGGSGVEL